MKIDLNKMNEAYRFLFGEIDKNLIQYISVADIEEDLNYIVDNLEDEHTKRIVHTTKTIENGCEDDEEEYDGTEKSVADEKNTDNKSRTIERSRSRSRDRSPSI